VDEYMLWHMRNMFASRFEQITHEHKIGEF